MDYCRQELLASLGDAEKALAQANQARKSEASRPQARWEKHWAIAWPVTQIPAELGCANL